jgi:hypothetical protein
MIQHTVAFRLHEWAHAEDFLDRARRLAAIEGVHEFEILRQVGTKNHFTHALSMRFREQADYDAYNEDPEHTAFVADVWVPNVAEFVELDYVAAP